MSILLSDLRKENKICYLIGDFNINLLNHDSHGLTGDFYDLMTSNSFLPLISRPTRITATSATLIMYSPIIWKIVMNHSRVSWSLMSLTITLFSIPIVKLPLSNLMCLSSKDLIVSRIRMPFLMP